MDVPISEVGYTSATIRREPTMSMMDMLWHWKTKTNNILAIFRELISF
jgi:hypothetical protein